MQIGNLHPLLVHLPIGIIILAFLMELWRLRKPSNTKDETIQFVLGVGALSAIFSLATGWLLGDNGSYDPNLLSDHKWMAVAFTVACSALFFIKRSDALWAKKIYHPLFAVTVILLIITGHFGGNITHGEGFLFKDSTSATIEIEDVDKAKVYADIVQPIFNNKCVSCHNANKTKGGLLLTSKAAILKGGDSGSLFDTLNDIANNLLAHRLILPIENEDHMPPKGKLQLTDEEKLLLQWWVKNQNCFDCIVADLQADKRTEEALASLEVDRSTRALIAKKLEAVDPETLEKIRQQGINVAPLAADSPLLIANLSRRKDLTEDDFDILKEVDDHVVELNLAHSNFDDNLAKQLKSFKHLTKLQLQYSALTDEGLKKLPKLVHLESLNLFGTSVSERVVGNITKMPNLRDVYLDPTTLSNKEFASLHASQISLHGKELDSLFASSELTPPVIVADGEIFNDSILITINNVFEDSKTFYRIERPQKDTLEFEYHGSFYLKQSGVVAAYAAKEGWQPSAPSRRMFLKSGAVIANASYAVPPHKKYSAAGAKTLFDKKRGTDNFVDGNWLGYERSHLLATIELQQPTEISSVAVGYLSAADSWIFSPVGYKVWGSVDGQHFKHIKTIDLPPNAPTTGIERNLFAIDFPKTKLKSVRIKVENQLKNPDWHQNPGGDSFIFIDEIVVN
ncbi:MAG: hypothetical protein CMH48_08495 [Muricauda sp.]|nr:c-type cytochrome domain-containing protein [Allomuricauda sp.]MBC30873.1 hypothetical protein [Allomuricauda sp.]|tara:strand:- start:23363 stop:25405 length:2043 start_codon:yes stop_codon:yes gene_type:complete